VLRDHTDTIIGQGYDGDVLLPVVLTAPADLPPGRPVRLEAAVDWLMCSDVCIPGNADISLTLPVKAEAPAPNPDWGAKVRATAAGLPRDDSHWKVSATRSGKAIALQVAPAAAVDHAPANLWFFSRDGLIAYDQPQKAVSDGHGGYTLPLAVASDGPPNATRLVGVLVAENGWLDNGALRGLTVDVPLGAAAAVTSTPAATSATSGSSQPGPLGGTLLLAFIGGLILNLMPCVFPVLGIKILGFVNQAGHDRRRVVAHGLTFAIGVLLSFWALAGVLAILRASGDQLGWGFQLQSPAFVYGLAILMLVFGMNMSGVFEFGLSATAVGSELQMKSGYAGSFFSGVLATVVATPCSAPFLAPALGAALAVSTAASFTIFTAIAVGLAMPYLLLSIFPAAVKALPRPGAWMETFKQFMAFPLYGTAAYLVWVLAAQTSEEGFRSVLFSFVLIALAIWMYGRWHTPGASAGRARFAFASLVIVGALGLWVGWPRSAIETTASGTPMAQIDWQPWSPENVAKLRGEGRIVYVDFTARWCATCQANKRLVFHDDDVLKYFADHKIATLRADWTNRDPRITQALASYGRSAVPFNLIWVPGRDQPVILPEILTASTVLDALNTSSKG
jgi:thiol:disulfide interchange protein DsbD